MIGVTPLGYATAGEFATILDVKLSQEDKTVADLLLRTAEDMIGVNTGGRVFLPIRAALAEDFTLAGATLTLDSAMNLFPGGGLIHIGEEVIEYANPQSQGPSQVAVTILRAGVGGTTAAGHTSGDTVYLVKGVEGQGTSVFPGDFLQKVALWTGTQKGAWQEWLDDSTTEGPVSKSPKQWVESGSGFAIGTLVWISAVWGYSWSVPAGIKRATLRWAQDMWLRLGGQQDLLSMEQVERHIVQYRRAQHMPPEVRTILDGYNRVPLG